MTLQTIQQRLKSAGLYTGAVDGLWGAGTDGGISIALDRAGIPALVAPVAKTPVVVSPSVLHPQYTIERFIEYFIETYEGGLSLDPKDTGNYYRGILVGSKYGVTGAALADYRNVTAITKADIAALTRDEAVKVGIELYYDRPDFDLLPWNPVTASVMDMGFNAGPKQSIKLMQRMVAAGDDGKIGRFTVTAYEDFLVDHGLGTSARMWCDVRNAFYEQVIKARPSNAKYRNGWRNRAAGFLPNTAFWNEWELPKSNRS